MNLKTNGLTDLKLTQSLETIWSQVTGTAKPGFIRILSDDLNWTLSEKWGKILKDKYSRIVLLGIGGSSMGARALANYKYSDQILFLDNIDPSEVQWVWNKIKHDLKNTGFMIISKSGESLEITSLIEVFHQLTADQNFNLFENSYIISENKKSILTDLCQAEKIPLIEMPLDVGGRFSVLTPVGMVLAHFLDFDIQKIRKGALDALAKKPQLLELATELAISIRNETDLFVFWSYSSQLRWFNQWLSQLWGESLGKNKTVTNGQAPKIPWLAGATGCSDQHSVYQHILESTQKKYVLITQSLEAFPEFNFKKPNLSFFKGKGFQLFDILSAERDATAQAMKQYGIPVSQMLFEKYDDETIGFLFAWFETLTAVLGHHLNINPFDQPAVQLGKRIALENLHLNG
ncbi:MAG: hypothetical protein H7235_09745 [Bdellovibrionaceae bacterium]|nr:hypothetical protein [Pseudobdellovibrionaceae bacterium]